MSKWNKALSIILVIAIAGAIGALGYVIATPKAGERFTEFYILGFEGKAEEYPVEFVMNEGKVKLVRYGESKIRGEVAEWGRVILGIVNHEHEQVTYQVEVIIDGEQVKVWLDGVQLDEIGPIVLTHEEQWEHEIGFTPQHVSDEQKVEFMLYKEGKPCFKDPPYLLISVTE